MPASRSHARTALRRGGSAAKVFVRSPYFLDSFWAFVLWSFTMATGSGLPVMSGFLSVTLALLCSVPLIWRRTHPDAAAAAIVCAHLLQLVTYPYPYPGNLAVPVILYAVAAYGREAWARRWLVGGFAASVIAGIVWSITGNTVADPLRAGLVFAFLTGSCASFVAAAWFMGSLRRSRIARIDAQREQALAQQREQVQAVQLAATEERQRIAREMHDIIAHSLSIIVVQSDGAKYVATEAPGSPEDRLARTAQAIETIQATARTALAETRRLVGVLHSDQGAELAPAQALADLPALVDQLASAGRSVTLHVEGDPRVHPGLGAVGELTAYRIVQESLTNVLKHAGESASAEVVVTHVPEGVRVVVSDDGRGAGASDGKGHGLIGMRERVAALGGTLSTGNRPTGGYQVTAFLPTPDERYAR